MAFSHMQLTDRQTVDGLPGIYWRIVQARLSTTKADRTHAAGHHVALSDEHARIDQSQAKLESVRVAMVGPATLCAWWLRHAPLAEPPTEATVKALIATSREIAALPPTTGSSPSAEWLAQFAGWFWTELDPPQRNLMLDSLAELVRLVGHQRWSDRIDKVHHSANGSKAG